MKKTIVALLLALCMVLGVFAGCTATEPAAPAAPAAEAPAAEAPAAEAPAAEAPAAEAKGLKVHKTYMGSDISQLQQLDNVDTNIASAYDYVMSFMYRAYPDETGTNYHYIPDLAAELPIQVDDYNWDIKIRQDAKWHNGDPINADTFIYTYKMGLDPIMNNRMANFIADYSVTIANATEYMKQGDSNTVAWEDVGYTKIDDYTIRITTVDVNTQKEICSQFTDRSMCPVYEPLFEAGMNETRTQTSYGSTLDQWMGCGPYFFDTWEYNSIEIFKKNPDHWLSDLFHFDEVQIRILPEMNARVEMWEKGELDDFSPDANTIEQYIDDPRMRTYGSTSVYHIDVNCQNPNNPISGSDNYRKALYHSINREVIARDLFGYQQPVGTYVNAQAGLFSPEGITYRESEPGKAVTAMVEEWGPYGYNPELAYEYLMKAYEECGVPEDTVITIIYGIDESDHAWKACAEYLKEEYKTIFKGKIDLEISVYAGMSATDFKAQGDDKWDLSPNDWARGMSRYFPYTCFYYYLSTYEGGPNNYHVPEFEEQYAYCESIKNGDYATLCEETAKLEKIYLEHVIHVPMMQEVSRQLFSEKMILPVKTYVPGFGWGTIYADMIVD